MEKSFLSGGIEKSGEGDWSEAEGEKRRGVFGGEIDGSVGGGKDLGIGGDERLTCGVGWVG